MLEAVHLTKEYEPGQRALDDVSYTVRPGELFCLFGANGAGKTTTINLFLNFIEPTEGYALIDGIDVTKQPLDAKEHVAYVSENVMLYGNFTARQNLDFFAVLGGKKGLGRKDYYEVLSHVGLPPETHERKVRSFSKGMRQKLGIAIAVIKDAPAVFLDEPTSGLDPKAAAEFIAILADLKARGKAILMSTHDIFRAREVADRIGIMKEGRMLSILDREAFAASNIEQLYLAAMHESMTQ